ncbi:MAG: Rieske (2Fe-2S) protein [Rhodospirillaceae bacterium]|nr:Rieske (2Fe-2S) protein [Rhodospirillaceae bacterium]
MTEPAATAHRVLCRLADIGDPGGRGFSLGEGRDDIFVIRRGRQVWGYVNHCPHAGTPLDWTQDVFLTLDRTFIQCATHGARFRIEDGHCAGGPCHGKPLVAVPVAVLDENVTLLNLAPFRGL